MIFIYIYVIRFWELERGGRGNPGNVKTRKIFTISLLRGNQPYPTFFENEPLSAHPRHFPLTGTAKPRFARGTFSYFKNQ